MIRALHELLLEHNGLASRLVVYTQMPRYMTPADQRKFMKPTMGKKGNSKYLRQLREAISEAKRCELVNVIDLPEGSVRMAPPGRACAQCGLHLSPGDIEAQRCQAPCSGPLTAAGVAAAGSGGTFTQS